MERVIVPIDFSDESIMALLRAIRFANRLGLHVRMVHVKKEKMFSHLLGQNVDAKWPDELLHEYLSKIQSQYQIAYTAGGVFDYSLRTGAINSELRAQAEEDKAYAYFLGLQGVSTLKDFLIGANAYRLLTSSSIPIFTSRADMPIGDFKNILLPLEYKVDSRIKIPWVAGLAKSLNAKVHIWGFTDNFEPDIKQKVTEYVRQAETYMDKLGIDYVSTYAYEDVYVDSILDYVKTNNIDLISVMSDVNDDPIERISGSHARKVLNESPVPVICIPAVLQ